MKSHHEKAFRQVQLLTIFVVNKLHRTLQVSDRTIEDELHVGHGFLSKA